MIKVISKGWALELAQAIDQAQKIVTLTALSFLPPNNHKPDEFGLLYSAIISAAHRIKDVVIILPEPSSQHPATAQNATAAATLAAYGCKCKLHPMPHLLHAKTCTIDQAEAWIGSGNYTGKAAMSNREAWMVTDDPRAIAELKNFQITLAFAAIDEKYKKP